MELVVNLISKVKGDMSTLLTLLSVCISKISFGG